MRHGFNFKKLCIALCLVALMLSLSGCVYLRLLGFKNQLKSFEKNITVDPVPGLSLQFHKPIVRDSDFVFITNSRATRQVKISEAPNEEVWTWMFEKQRGKNTHRLYSLNFTTYFEDGLFSQMEIDETFVQLLGKEFTLAMFKSMGKAKINTLRRSATAEVDIDSLPDVPLPSLETIFQVMGEPTRTIKQRRDSDQEAQCEYQFVFRNPDNHKKAGQFKISFKGDPNNPEKEITGFRVTGKAR